MPLESKPGWRIGHGLRAKILLLLLCAFVPAAVVNGLGAWAWRQEALRDAEQETRALARLGARDYEALIFRTTPLLLHSLSLATPALDTQDGPGATAALTRFLQEHPEYINVMAARAPDGTVFASGLPLPGPTTLGDREYFRRVLETRNYAVGQFVLGKATGKPTLVCAYPVLTANGAVAAVLAVGIDLEQLARGLAHAQQRTELGITLLDRTGTVLVATWAHPEWVGRHISTAPVWPFIRDRQTPSYRGPSMDGMRKVVAAQAIATPTGEVVSYVAATLPEAAALGQAERFLTRSLAGFAASALIALLGLYLVGRRSILRGVESLVATAERLAGGDLAARTGEVGDTDEFRHLAAAFDSMAEKLSRRDAEQRAAGETLRESEERYRTLVENTDLGITRIDPQYRVVMANAAQGRLLGRDPRELVGRLCFEVFEQRSAPCEHCPGARAMQTGQSAVAEARGVRTNGSAVEVRIRAIPLPAVDGIPQGFIEVVEDRSEAARLRTEQERLERKMLQAQKLESLGVLAGGIAHDFNNLLVGILGNAELALLKSSPESPVRPYLQRIDMAVQRAADLANQMLAYSGKGRFVVEPIRLSHLVGEMEHLLRTVVAKTATLRYDLPEGLPLIEADATQVRQVVMNLITNASDSLGGQPGGIAVSTGVVEADRGYLTATQLDDALPEGTYVYVEVNDTGCGMERATQEKIFDPFYTTKDTGRGLGLAAVLGIVRGHRGALKVYSEPGRGTTFRVYFPASGAASKSTAAPDQAPHGGPPTAHGTILVVDDEEHIRTVTGEQLESQGYTVLTAEDGVSGVELFRQHAAEIALVILDMTMPRMGGQETFRELQKIRPEVPVLLCSGYNERDAIHRFAGHGVAGFLQKPFRIQALLEKLEEVLG